jgi:hypothetical protein
MKLQAIYMTGGVTLMIAALFEPTLVFAQEKPEV